MHAEICIQHRAQAACMAYRQARDSEATARRRRQLPAVAMWRSIADACLDEIDDLAAAARAGVTVLGEVA